MKVNFKRLLSAVAAVAMTATCMSAATMPSFFASAEDVNIALENGVVAMADSVNAQYGGDPSNVNDGSNTTRWQSNAKGSSEADMAWIGYNFGKAANFSKVVVYWETARGTVDGVRFYVSNNGTNWTPVTATPTSDAETNLKNDDNGDMYSYEYTFEEQTAMFLKMEIFKMHNNKEFPSIWELEVYGNFDVDELAAALTVLQETIEAANALTESNYTPETWATLQDALAEANEALTSDDAAVISAATDAVNEAVAALEFDALAKLAEAVAAANAKVTAENSYKFTADSKAVLNGYLAEAATYEGATVDETNVDAINALTQNILDAIAALQSSNLAIGKDFILGSNQGDQLKEEFINDGDLTTRWASNEDCRIQGEKITLDFGVSTTVDRLEIYWETARPTAENVTIQYSQDGKLWADLDVFVAGSLNDAVADSTYLQMYSFNAISTRYIRVYVFGENNIGGNIKDKVSIFEFEAYNTFNLTTEAIEAVKGFEVIGAQTRVNGEDETKNDLRFVVNFSEDLYAEIEAGNITDLGVVLEKMADGTTRTVSTKYLRNVNIDKYGMYTYTVALLGIADPDSLWGCTAYYTTAEGTTETAQIVRSVNG